MKLHSILTAQGVPIGLRFREDGVFYDIATSSITFSLNFLQNLNITREPVVLHNGEYRTPREIKAQIRVETVMQGSRQHIAILEVLNQHRVYFPDRK